MTTGDVDDTLARLKAFLPTWYGTDTPLLDAALYGPSVTLSFVYELIQYSILQTRIKTATGPWLDLIAKDYFARAFQRRPGETDDDYRARIIAEIFRLRATRPAIISAVTDLTGRVPIVFEPPRIADTGEYGGPFFAYGGFIPGEGTTCDSTIITSDSVTVTCDAGQGFIAVGGYGAWGSLEYPDQFLITVFRPPGAGIPGVDGYGGYLGSYGSGAIEYVNIRDILGPVTDADIYATIARTVAAGVTAWTRIDS